MKKVLLSLIMALFTAASVNAQEIPVAPVIEAYASNDTVHLTWEPVESATAYRLYYGTKQLGPDFIESAVDIQVVQPGEYCFTVTAVNEIGESEHSNEACATIVLDPDMEIPAAPVVNARVENDRVYLSWDKVEGATFYSIYYEGQLLGSTANLGVDMGLQDPGEYCFVVTAGNIAGESEFSEPACVKYGEGIEDNETAFNIYPNPVIDELVIETTVNVETISIYDAFGRLMTTVNGQVATVDVSEYNAGVYIMKIKTDNGDVAKRFVKK